MFGIASSGFALLAMTQLGYRNDTVVPVIARAFMPVAISYMRTEQFLHLFHVWDCFVGLCPPRNDTVVPVIARAFMPVAISYMRTEQFLHLFHVWDCFVGLCPPRNDTVGLSQ